MTTGYTIDQGWSHTTMTIQYTIDRGSHTTTDIFECASHILTQLAIAIIEATQPATAIIQGTY